MQSIEQKQGINNVQINDITPPIPPPPPFAVKL